MANDTQPEIAPEVETLPVIIAAPAAVTAPLSNVEASVAAQTAWIESKTAADRAGAVQQYPELRHVYAGALELYLSQNK